MEKGAFDLEAFYAEVQAARKERSAIRQDLVRGLKDYFVSLYGYDRHGAETVLLLPDRMGQPFIYGFGVLRILHDRRLAESTKIAASRRAIATIDYSDDNGIPYGIAQVLDHLVERGAARVGEARYVLVATAGSETVFAGAERGVSMGFVRWLVDQHEMPEAERGFWGHSLIARAGEGARATRLANTLLGADALSTELRIEIARSWVSARQPRLFVDIPDSDGTPRAEFVLQHMPFWVSHAASWPTRAMVRWGLVWLARLEQDPESVVARHIDAREGFEDAVHSAIVEILSEFRSSIPAPRLQQFIEQGIALAGPSPTRRQYYRLGSDLFGPEYLQRASEDSANSVRQWAAKQMHQRA